jgi:hypothetical protein
MKMPLLPTLPDPYGGSELPDLPDPSKIVKSLYGYAGAGQGYIGKMAPKLKKARI